MRTPRFAPARLKAEPTRKRCSGGDGFEIETVLTCRAVGAEFNVAEVPSVERSRLFGDSNLHAIRDGLRVLRTILVEARSAARLHRVGVRSAHDQALRIAALAARGCIALRRHIAGIVRRR